MSELETRSSFSETHSLVFTVISGKTVKVEVSVNDSLGIVWVVTSGVYLGLLVIGLSMHDENCEENHGELARASENTELGTSGYEVEFGCVVAWEASWLGEVKAWLESHAGALFVEDTDLRWSETGSWSCLVGCMFARSKVEVIMRWSFIGFVLISEARSCQRESRLPSHREARERP